MNSQPDQMPRRIRPNASAADFVVADIERRVRLEHLAPGFHLGTKHELCDTYQLAPATLGEALRVLRARGAVEVRPGPGGGVFVAEQSPLVKLAYEVIDLRQAGAEVNDFVAVLNGLDSAVIRDAAEHRTEADLDDLEALMSELAEHWGDSEQGVHVNWRLHKRIAAISPNIVMRTFYSNMVDYITRESASDVTMGVLGFRPDSEARLAVHRDLVSAIRSQDPDELLAAIRAHRSSAGD